MSFSKTQDAKSLKFDKLLMRKASIEDRVRGLQFLRAKTVMESADSKNSSVDLDKYETPSRKQKHVSLLKSPAVVIDLGPPEAP